uniref:Cation/H+ exchanger transmembrane domain-containing protein n=1 Tax=Compsopogon caeruleus TaxID=31354 RepID=A0A7S1TIL2_9RHOD|mmetsp:Transcript_887/g.1912  ORF Transcript_887/g.1912 Transcript_887/m.1912 type:complete len:864 (+) Transcript_887:811-3402(+)
MSFGDIVIDIIRLSLGGAAMGLAFGIVTVLLLGFFYEVREVEVSLTVITGFLGFWVAQSPSRLSGVICNVFSGLTLSALGKQLISPGARDPMESFWRTLAWIANTFVFVYAGVLIVVFAWVCAGDPLKWSDYLISLFWFLLLQVVRFVLVFLLLPFFRVNHQWFSWKEAVVTSLAGLRGAVSLILALKVALGDVSNEISARVVVWTCIIVFLTLSVNGILITPLLKLLKLGQRSKIETEYLWRARGLVLHQTLKIFDRLSVDSYFRAVRWDVVVQKTIPISWTVDGKATSAYARFLNKHSSVDDRTFVSYPDEDAGLSNFSNPLDSRTDDNSRLTIKNRQESEIVQTTVGEETIDEKENDREVRRRFLLEALRHLHGAYGSTVSDLAALQILEEDIKHAIEANDCDKRYQVLDFIGKRQPSTGVFSQLCSALPFLRRITIQERSRLIINVVQTLRILLREPFLQDSPVVFAEIEEIYYRAFLSYVETLGGSNNSDIVAGVTHYAIQLIFYEQGRILCNLEERGLIGDEDRKGVQAELIEMEKSYFPLHQSASKRIFSNWAVSDHELVLRNCPLFVDLPDHDYTELRELGEVRELAKGERISLSPEGLLLIIEGSLRPIESDGTGHWCFERNSIIVGKRALSQLYSELLPDAPQEQYSVCMFVQRARVFVLENSSVLADHKFASGFLELCRAFTLKLCLEELRKAEEKVYNRAIISFPLSRRDPRVGRIAHLLIDLPYATLIEVPVGETRSMLGPASVVVGQNVRVVFEREDSSDDNQRSPMDVSAPVVLPFHVLICIKNTGSCSAYVTVATAERVEDRAFLRQQRWIPRKNSSVIIANARFTPISHPPDLDGLDVGEDAGANF